MNRQDLEKFAATRPVRVAVAVSRVLFPLLAFAYLAWMLRGLAGKLPPAREIAPAIAVSALIAACFPVLLLVLAWKWTKVLECVGDKRLSLRQTFAFYAQTNIHKYLPSNMLHFASRIMQSSTRLALDGAVMGKALIVEVGADLLLTATFIAACALATCLAPEPHWFNTSWRPAVALALGLACAITCAVVLEKSAAQRPGGARRTVLPVMIGAFAGHLYLGLGFLLLLHALGVQLAWGTAVLVMLWQSASWLAGFLTPGLPAGLGVREAVLTLTVGSLVDVRAAMIAAALYRIAQIAGEVLAFLVAGWLAPRHAGRAVNAGQ